MSGRALAYLTDFFGTDSHAEVRKSTLQTAWGSFTLVAEVVKQQIHPMKNIDLWGFNGSAPGPTIQVNEGDHVRVIFDNHLPEPTSIHWHGFEDTIQNDGQPGISQPPVKPGDNSWPWSFYISGSLRWE